MQQLETRQQLEDYLSEYQSKDLKIGFAPTMGALHRGHLSLYENAKNNQNDIIISSIFVNPTQFNRAEDLEKYPRTLEADLQLLRNFRIIDAVYTPKISDLYPNGVESQHYDFDGLEFEMEGKFRPGHFDGVGTVVENLLRQVKPNHAYFGEKDFQQLQIIKNLNQKLNLGICIHSVPVFREENGLAMSSRNERLSHDERHDARIIFETLKWACSLLETQDFESVKGFVEKQFINSVFNLEYFCLASETTLKELSVLETTDTNRLFIAVFCRDIRLIDTIHMPLKN